MEGVGVEVEWVQGSGFRLKVENPWLPVRHRKEHQAMSTQTLQETRVYQTGSWILVPNLVAWLYRCTGTGKRQDAHSIQLSTYPTFARIRIRMDSSSTYEALTNERLSKEAEVDKVDEDDDASIVGEEEARLDEELVGLRRMRLAFGATLHLLEAIRDDLRSHGHHADRVTSASVECRAALVDAQHQETASAREAMIKLAQYQQHPQSARNNNTTKL